MDLWLPDGTGADAGLVGCSVLVFQKAALALKNMAAGTSRIVIAPDVRLQPSQRLLPSQSVLLTAILKAAE